MFRLRRVAKAVPLGGLALLLLPAPGPVPAFMQPLNAQAFPGRLRRPPAPPEESSGSTGGAQTSAPVPAPPAAQSAVPAVQPAAAPAAALPPSMLEQPAQPATIRFAAQSLTISADNSSLAGILHQLSSETGMEVQGLGNDDERVFGTFGPGSPQDVVNDLLNGTPYNILMEGVLANGAPRQLVLSPVAHLPAAAAPVTPAPAAKGDAGDAQQAQPLPPGETTSPAAPAIAPAAVKSPDELFKELQQMRARQQQ